MMRNLLPHLYPGNAAPAPAASDLPRIAPELVEALQARFPDRLPPPDTDLLRLRFLQGQASVVAYLAAVSREQRSSKEPLKVVTP